MITLCFDAVSGLVDNPIFCTVSGLVDNPTVVGLVDNPIFFTVLGLSDEQFEPSRNQLTLRFGRSTDDNSHVAKNRFKRMIDDMYFSMRG